MKKSDVGTTTNAKKPTPVARWRPVYLESISSLPSEPCLI